MKYTCFKELAIGSNLWKFNDDILKCVKYDVIEIDKERNIIGVITSETDDEEIKQEKSYINVKDKWNYYTVDGYYPAPWAAMWMKFRDISDQIRELDKLRKSIIVKNKISVTIDGEKVIDYETVGEN